MTGTTFCTDEDKATSPCLILIQGRYALRVRAIPLVTHDKIGPNSLAYWLAYGEKLYRLGDIRAFHILNGRPAAIPAQFWAGIVTQLETLERELRAAEVVKDALESEWMLRALQILPVAYIWLDEFEAVWLERFTPTDIRPIHSGYFAGKTWVIDNNPHSWTLNLSPYLTAPQSLIVIGESEDALVTNCEPQTIQNNAVVVSGVQGKGEVSLNWKMRIQAEAALRWIASLEVGAEPTRHGIAPELAKWCRENEIKTDKTKYPSSSYISRHVLREWNPPSNAEKVMK